MLKSIWRWTDDKTTESSWLINRLVTLISSILFLGRYLKFVCPTLMHVYKSARLHQSVSFSFLFFCNIISQVLFCKIQAFRDVKEISCKRRYEHERHSLRLRDYGFHESISCSIWCVLLPRTIKQERRNKHMVLHAFAQRYPCLPTNYWIREPIRRAGLSHSRIPHLFHFASSFRTHSRATTFDEIWTRDLFGSCCVRSYRMEPK